MRKLPHRKVNEKFVSKIMGDEACFRFNSEFLSGYSWNHLSEANMIFFLKRGRRILCWIRTIQVRIIILITFSSEQIMNCKKYRYSAPFAKKFRNDSTINTSAFAILQLESIFYLFTYVLIYTTIFRLDQ